MSDQVVNIPASRLEEMLALPVRVAEIEAAEMVCRGDVAGASRHLQTAVQQQAQQRAQIAAQQQAAPSPVVQSSTPAGPAAPIAPEPPAFVTQPRTMGEEMLGRAWQAAQQRKTADDTGAAMTDMRMPMGLRARR